MRRYHHEEEKETVPVIRGLLLLRREAPVAARRRIDRDINEVMSPGFPLSRLGGASQYGNKGIQEASKCIARVRYIQHFLMPVLGKKFCR